MIKKLQDDSGSCQEGNVVLNPMLSQYFVGLFATEVNEPDPHLSWAKWFLRSRII